MAVSALLIFVQGWAQQSDGDLNRELDVTREYEPTVRSAVKLGIKPNMVDTASLRVDVDYEITPDPIQYRSEVTPIKPVSVSVDDLREELPFYIKAGLGVGGAILGFLLSGFGYVSGVGSAQTETAVHGIVLSSSLIPAACFFVGVIALLFYPISKEYNEKMQAELKVRRSRNDY